ncbi:MAG: hydrogenase maturation nickel metallochaperone HypA [Candidatus Acidiferrales bacterium]
MHEIGIATAIVDAVHAESARVGGLAPVSVGVRIGEFAAVDPEALRFAFEVITRGTDLQSLSLKIEICPYRRRCAACARVFEVNDGVLECPHCGAPESRCAGGDELELAYLEVKDEPPAA